MAVTKILSKRMRIDRLVRYVLNPDKTDESVLTYCQYCKPRSAAKQMMATKEQYCKEDGIQAFHIIQSFKKGEIEPNLALEIGKRFIREHLPDYEAVLGTHIDKEHIHNHIAFNSVSFRTGKKYHSTAESYYRQIRKISDDLCRNYGLSIIFESEYKSVSYAEWKMRKAGVYTLRELFDMDFKECCSLALDYGNFCALMEDRGYEVRHRSRYPSFLPQGAKHPFRAKRNRNPLTVEDIESVIEGNLLNPESEVIVSKTYRPFIPYGKQKGFRALYVSWMYVLGLISKGKKTVYKVSREEIRRFDRYKAQAEYVELHRIDTQEELDKRIDALKSKIEHITKKRINFNSKKKKNKRVYDALSVVESLSDAPELYNEGLSGVEDEYRQYQKAMADLEGKDIALLKGERNEVYSGIAEANRDIRNLRKEIRLCEAIAADSGHVHTLLSTDEQLQLNKKEMEKEE